MTFALIEMAEKIGGKYTKNVEVIKNAEIMNASITR